MCLPDFLQFGSMHPEEGFGVRRMIRNTFVSPCEGAHLRQLSGSLLRCGTYKRRAWPPYRRHLVLTGP